MDAVELGKRIKEARLAKKMTQSEVVGDFITRNMLSQIESGVAMPSVKTLSYLARVLGLPTEQLLSGGETSDICQVLVDAKAALLAGNYGDVPQQPDDFPPAIADELYALAARASLCAARERLQAGQSQQAVAFGEHAVEWFKKGLYANEAMRQEASDLLRQAAGTLHEYYEKILNDE